MPAPLREKVWQRAYGCCEYCRLPHDGTVLPHEIDHIRSQKHAGPTTLENLCLACSLCNAHKGPNVAGYDPDTDALVRLFNPRTDEWHDHLRWNGATLVGKTAIGRATIVVLRINAVERVEHRRLLIDANMFPARERQ
jgi:hypothetical protein